MRKLLLLPFLIFICSCEKNENATDFGPETTAQKIQNVESSYYSQSDPLTIKKGDFVYQIKTQEIFSGATPIRSLLEEEGLTVTDREEIQLYCEDSDEWLDYSILTVVTEQIDFSDPSEPHNKFKDIHYLRHREKPCRVEEAAGNDLPATVDEQEYTLTFHNLVVREEKVPRPAKVEEREPCPAAQDCSVLATHISYDVVVHQEGQPSRKNKVETLFSTEVPYFGHVLKNCITSVAAVEDSRPLVRQCSAVLDYIHGTPVGAPLVGEMPVGQNAPEQQQTPQQNQGLAPAFSSYSRSTAFEANIKTILLGF